MMYKEKPVDFNKRFDIAGCFLQHDGKFVLLKRHAHKASGNKWGLPAGKKETNENIEEAVLREVEEETGLALPASSVHYFSSLYVRNGEFDFEWHMFSANFETRPEIIINPNEHSEFCWVTPQQALQMPDLIHDLWECVEIFYRIPIDTEKGI